MENSEGHPRHARFRRNRGHRNNSVGSMDDDSAGHAGPSDPERNRRGQAWQFWRLRNPATNALQNVTRSKSETNQSSYSGRSGNQWRNRRDQSENNQAAFKSRGAWGNRRGQSESNHRSRFDQNDEHGDFRRKRPGYAQHIGYKYLDALLGQPVEEAMTKIMENKPFFELLEKQLSPDLIVMIIKLISNFCDCKFKTLQIRVLQKCLCPQFINAILSYISILEFQNKNDRRGNSNFWKDPDDFWINLLKICETTLKVMPQKFGELVSKLAKVICKSLPEIESNHNIHINDEIKSKFANLIQTAEVVVLELEKKEQKVQRINKDEGEPPDDFHDISVYPTTMELISDRRPFLRRNVVRGPYRDVAHYLDVQFRLLREDFVGPLREGICAHLQRNTDKSKGHIQNVKIHKRVQFLHPETATEHYCVLLKFNFSNKRSSFSYENSRRFMYGSLVCFTRDDFRTLIFGKIVGRDEKYLKNSELVIGFDENEKPTYNTDYMMIECSVYFEPYYHVLNVMKRMTDEDFPMKNYIIDVDTTPVLPEYISPAVVYEIEGSMYRTITWAPYNGVEENFFNFNPSQNTAFIAGLTRQFSIIQGPPGTGKTFVGLRIAQTLLENRKAWYARTPMLIICYTNHALDQFLEGLSNVTDNIVRVGGQSKNENLKKFNLKSHAYKMGDGFYKSKINVTRCLSKIKTITDTLNMIRQRNSIINFQAFGEVIPNFQNSWLATAKKEDLLDWLLGEEYATDQDAPIQEFNNMTLTDNLDVASEDEYQEEEDEPLMENDFEDLLTSVNPQVNKPLFRLSDLNSKIQSYNRELTKLGQQLRNMEYEDYEVLFAFKTLEMDTMELIATYDYVQEQLGLNREGIHLDRYKMDVRNAKYISREDRWSLYFHWVNLYKNNLLRRYEAANNEFREIYKAFNELKDLENIKILRSSEVIGMTTTSAARLHDSLQMIKCPIVIVEEAAEVLEAHIVTALTRDCKHLILIGDHQQLKPSTSNYQIERFYDLGISLFERMILNDVQCFTLNVQHRMRPEISSLIKPAIYPNLQDHESVFDRPKIKGVVKCLYFIDHKHPEQAETIGTTKKNRHEVTFLIQLANYLILNGYKPSEITILAAYLGQMFELQKERAMYKTTLGEVKITVLDNYQGEENDIILLSLVRNNADNKIGFLGIDNRVCVALSRAKNGLYVMGNMTQLCANSQLWVKINETLSNQESVGPALSLKCQIHNKLTEVDKAEDFDLVAEGGCDQICGMLLACEHNCQRLCHILDREHNNNKCQEDCRRKLCDSDSLHICRKKCYEECGPCSYLVTRLLDCTHEAVMECSIDVADYKCMVLVETTLPCGHEAQKPCSIEPERHQCPIPCDTRLECGHACTKNCHTRDDPDHLKYRCLKNCEKPRVGCNDPGREGHMCPKLCHDECLKCTVVVKKSRTVCPHYFNVACCVNVDELECTKPCKKILPCGHKCKNDCSSPCGPCTEEVQKVIPDCKHTQKVPCYMEPNRKKCFGVCPRIMACGHVCKKRCNVDCNPMDCKEMVDLSIVAKCRHILKRVPCFARTSYSTKGTTENLETYCVEPCGALLNCGPENKHLCNGSCGECNQGRIHKRCTDKCGQILVCNHECEVFCRETCKPCKKPCSFKCRHSACKKRCGEPCSKCIEPCCRKCEHQKCEKLCGEICSVPPCKMPCQKKLEKCGHQCVGFCGDPCPSLCRICDRDELQVIFFGDEDEDDARFVELQDCGHVVESNGMERWLGQSGEIKFEFCPKCKTTINTTARYSDYVKKAIEGVMQVKRKQYGNKREIAKKRTELLEKIKQLSSLSTDNEFHRHPSFQTILKNLKALTDRLNIISSKGRAQPVSLVDLNSIQIKFGLMMEAYKITMKSEGFNRIDPRVKRTVERQEGFILENVLRQLDDVTNTEIEDIRRENNRLNRMVQLGIMLLSPQAIMSQSNLEVNNKVTVALSLVNSLAKYGDETDALVKKHLNGLKDFLKATVSITEVERQQIVQAIGLRQGHWFKCPNGHIYAIGECGGAMQVGKCNECGARIGGQNHHLLGTNALAPEMDGARHAAWSNVANMANYRLD